HARPPYRCRRQARSMCQRNARTRFRTPQPPGRECSGRPRGRAPLRRLFLPCVPGTAPADCCTGASQHGYFGNIADPLAPGGDECAFLRHDLFAMVPSKKQRVVRVAGRELFVGLDGNVRAWTVFALLDRCGVADELDQIGRYSTVVGDGRAFRSGAVAYLALTVTIQSEQQL